MFVLRCGHADVKILLSIWCVSEGDNLRNVTTKKAVSCPIFIYFVHTKVRVLLQFSYSLTVDKYKFPSKWFQFFFAQTLSCNKQKATVGERERIGRGNECLCC